MFAGAAGGSVRFTRQANPVAARRTSVMHVVPDGVVNATSSPSGVPAPERNATWKSAASTGPAFCTHAIASAAGAPGAGAGELVEVGDVLVAEVCCPAGRDGEIGVSLVEPGVSAVEQPVSTDTPAEIAANTTRIRIGSG